MRHGLRLLVALLLLSVAGLIGLADTAAFAATNTTAGSVIARLPAGAFADTLTSGGGQTCVVKTDGALTCWGFNLKGEATPPSGTFTAVSGGESHTCGVKTNGTVACWGEFGFGEARPPSGTFTAVSAGTNHTCGVKTDGTLACWGSNDAGRASPPSGTFTPSVPGPPTPAG